MNWPETRWKIARALRSRRTAPRLLDLGRFGEAAEIFAVKLDALPATAVAPDSRTRFAVRRVTARAGIGDVCCACAVVADALPTIERVDSATIRSGLCRFLDEARRQADGARHPAVLDAVQAVTDVDR